MDTPCEKCGGETYIVREFGTFPMVIMCKACGNYVEECSCTKKELEWDE